MTNKIRGIDLSQRIEQVIGERDSQRISHRRQTQIPALEE